jgi:hypothetical protein
MLYRAKRAREDEIRQQQAIAHESETEAGRKARNYFDRIQGIMQQFIIYVKFNKKPTFINAILRLRTYGIAIHKNTKAEGVID